MDLRDYNKFPSPFLVKRKILNGALFILISFEVIASYANCHSLLRRLYTYLIRGLIYGFIAKPHALTIWLNLYFKD